MEKIHVEGMGVLGSLLAWQLYRNQIPFTWNDNQSPIQSWVACTGLIYPSGDEFDQDNYLVWERWISDPPWMGIPHTVHEVGSYWFRSKHPPHKAKYEIVHDVGYLRLGELPSFHLNAQEFVQCTRVYFQGLRTDEAPIGVRKVVAHGFDRRRLVRYLWGWCVMVELEIPDEIWKASRYRPMFYLRDGRYVINYADPKPGTTEYYAGSSLIVQKEPKELDIEGKFKKWAEALVTKTELRISRVGMSAHGWRPDAAKDDAPLVREIDGDLVCKPLWSSGVRHAPALISAVMGELK